MATFTAQKYSWDSGFGVFNQKGVDAQKIGQRLEELYEQNGGTLTPAQYVEDAEDPTQESRKTLNWNDQECGIEWRLHQARFVLKTLRVEVTQPGKGVRVTYANIHVQDGKEHFYRPIHLVLQDPDAEAQTRKEAITYLIGFTKRLEALELPVLRPVLRAMQVAFDELRK